MPDNFQKTVNLRVQAERKRRELLKERSFERVKSPKIKKAVVKKAVSRVKEIDRVFNEKAETDSVKHELQKINRPEIRPEGGGVYKNISIILAVVIILLTAYFFFTRSNEPNITVTRGENSGSGWYSVKLINGESYYGQIEDTGADPVVIKNVYYNYDQLNSQQAPQEGDKSGNLRLVKRGKETHGPDGNMSLVRTQVVYMEILKEESKVLRAILDYEK